MVAPFKRLREGTLFADKYRIVSRVGEGSMGAVYRVEEIGSGDVFALKIVGFDTLTDPRSVRRFEREAAAGISIDSPGIARTFAIGVDDDKGTGWLVMEYVEGQNLLDYVRQRAPLELPAAKALLYSMFEAMAAAHQAHVVHRDLKPENIRVDCSSGKPQVKVLDFGIAKALDSGTLSGTKPGLGTPLWTAPEQALRGYEPHPNGDVWALGLLAFFVLTGRIYFRHAEDTSSVAALALELLRDPIVAPSQRAAELGGAIHVPRGFDAWFLRAVSRVPSERFQDATEAHQALRAVLDGPAAEDEIGVLHAHSSASERRERGGPTSTGGWLVWVLLLSLSSFGYVLYRLLDVARH